MRTIITALAVALLLGLSSSAALAQAPQAYYYPASGLYTTTQWAVYIPADQRQSFLPANDN